MEHKAADVTTLKVKQLKALIQAAGLSHADCFEKSDLRARATQAQAKLAAAPAPKPKKKSLIGRCVGGGRGGRCDGGLIALGPGFWFKFFYSCWA